MGAVDGHAQDLSSARGELQGQTALAVVANLLLTGNNALEQKVKLIGDNKGIQTKTARCQHTKLGHHREKNVDLFLEYEHATKPLQRQVDWVKSHQDDDTPWESIDDLVDLKLSTAATLNCWCDKQANIARTQFIMHADADVYPAEKWALYINTP